MTEPPLIALYAGGEIGDWLRRAAPWAHERVPRAPTLLCTWSGSRPDTSLSPWPRDLTTTSPGVFGPVGHLGMSVPGCRTRWRGPLLMRRRMVAEQASPGKPRAVVLYRGRFQGGAVSMAASTH